MPIFDAKPRSWDAYLAGIGASGALMASASVLFVILVGVVTFSTWPHAGSLLGDGGKGDVALQQALPAPSAPGTGSSARLNLVRLLGGTRANPPGASSDGGRVGGAGGGFLPGEGNGGSQGGSNGRGGEPQQAPQPPSAPQQSNVVSQAVSGVGNTVQSDTESLGNSLGGTSGTGLGGVLSGLGSNLNNDLQSLAGNH
jgi:hypothetical protein